MTEEDMKKLKQTVDYFGHWYDVIGEEIVAILEKAVNELEATKELEELYKKADENWWNAQQIIKELQEQIEKMKCCINDLVHLGEFDEHTDEEYFNYQVHEALKNAEQFIKEIKEK